MYCLLPDNAHQSPWRYSGIPGVQLGINASLKFSSSARCTGKEPQTTRNSYHVKKGEIIYIYIYIFVYIYTFIHMFCAYIYTHMHIYKYIYIKKLKEENIGLGVS